MDAVPPGSYLAISQIASDVAADEVAEGVQRYAQACPSRGLGQPVSRAWTDRAGSCRYNRAARKTGARSSTC